MAQSIGDLFITLGFNVDNQKLDDFQNSLKNTFSALKDFAGIAGAGLAVGALTEMLKSTADTQIQFRNLRTELGLNENAVRGFAAAWHAANPNTDQFAGLSAAESVTQYLNAARYGRRNEGIIFGVTGQEKTLEEVNKKIKANYQFAVKEWGLPEVNSAIKAIYGTADAINVLRMSTEEYNKAAEKGPITEEAKKNLEDYDTALANLSSTWNQFKADVLSFPAQKLSDILGTINRISEQGVAKATGITRFENYAEKHGYGSALERISEVAGHVLFGYGLSANQQANNLFQHKALNSSYSIANQLRSYGWDEAHIQGALAHLSKETVGFNPNAYGHGKEAKGMPEEAYGILQLHPDRQADFLAVMGKDIHGSSVQDQVAFMEYELTKGKERRHGNDFFAAKGKDAAEAIFNNEYERSATTINITNHNDAGISQGDAYNQGVIDATFAIQHTGQVR